jgi:dipeptidyl aminopeptidase/acylaminoacyl peptidase
MTIRSRLVPSVVFFMLASGGLGGAMAHGQASVGGKGESPKPAGNAGTTPLIPRAALFGNSDRSQGRISPDGTRIAFLAPVNGVMNVWVGPSNKITDAKPVTNDDKRGIRQYSWSYNNQNILFTQDKGGDENWRIYSVDLVGGGIRDLTPLENTQARIEAVSEKFPDEIVVGLNDRNPMFHDLHRVNIKSGERKLLLENTGYAGFSVDDDYRVRIASKVEKDGSVAMLRSVEEGKAGFEAWFTVPMADANLTSPVGFNKDGTKVYIIDSRDRNTAALFEMDMKTGDKKLIFEDPRCDVSGVMINPISKTVDAVESEYLRAEWALVQSAADAAPSMAADFMAIRKAAGDGTIAVLSRTQDDTKWTVGVIPDNGSPKTWLVERGDLTAAKRSPKVTLLWNNRVALADQPLVKMFPVVIKSRDGLDMVSYLTLPKDADTDGNGKPERPLPMVLNVHGGPWARDSWGLDPEHQWLANRGYAVLSVNFRSSTGFGKDFLNKGNMQWAATMHDDLIDAVNWAVDQKIAVKDKVAIYGGSYGGYAALTGLTFTPDVFACGVSIVGPSNLVTLLNSIPAYWGPALDLMTKQVGDHRTEEGRKFLESRSPLTLVDKITKPLLIGQGANDPRVKQAESDQIVAAMQAKKIPVTYVLYPDEGHGFARPPNRMSFYAVAETFLAQVLGGRVEPIGDAFKGSTIQVPAGEQFVPGVSEALAAVKAATPPAPASPAKDEKKN